MEWGTTMPRRFPAGVRADTANGVLLMPLLSRSRLHFLVAAVVLSLALPLWADSGAAGAFWPQSLGRGSLSLSLGEPKLESWDFLRLRLRAPVQCRDGSGSPFLATVTLAARTFPNRTAQTVTLSDFEVLALEAEGTGESALSEWKAKVAEELRDLRRTVPVDPLIDAFAASRPLPSIEISSEAPRIFVSTKPAVILQFDGPPMWLPVNGSKVSYAVNTNWDIFYDNKSTFYYLLAGDLWLATHDPLTEEWVIPKSLPKELKNLPRTPDFANVWKHLPYNPNPDAVPPRVFYTETAAELILIEGDPVLEPIAETGISIVKNTQSDVFFEAASKQFFTVLAGRWFETGELGGYWRNALRPPVGLAAIPADHPKAHVRVHLAGTPESRREAYRALIPHLATIRREGPTLELSFAGRPKYVPIDGTSLLWVPNATVPILAHAGTHYACQHGVWFQAAKPEGPWSVASSLPEDIYRIPSRSPVFHLSFVRLVASDADTVTFGYTGGYENLFVHNGLVVYGTGFPHPPALQYGAYTYPIYFAQPSTYGVGAWYHPESHVFLRGRPGYGPFGGFGATCRFNSVTSHYFRAQTLYGEDTGESPSLAFLPYTAAYGKLLTTYEPYARWGGWVVRGGGVPSAGSSPGVAAKKAPSKVTIQIGEPRVGAPVQSPPTPESGFRPPDPQ